MSNYLFPRRITYMDQKNAKKEGYYSSLVGFRRAVPIILIALAIFVAVCFIADGTGALGSGLGDLLLGLFSAGAYAIPALLAIHGVFYAEDVAKKRTVSRIIFSVITVLFVSAIEYTIVFWGKEPVFDPVGCFSAKSTGGFIGSVVAFGLIKVLGPIGIYIVAGALLAIYITFFFAGKNSAAGRVLLSILGAIAGVLALIELGIKKLFSVFKKKKENREYRANEKKNAELLDDQFFSVNNGMSELRIDDLGIHEKKSSLDVAEDPTLQSSVFPKNSVKSDELPPPARKSAEPKTERKSVNIDYGFDTASVSVGAGAYEADKTEAKEAKAEERKEEARSPYSAESDSAESVFTQSFDPFDFATGEKMASKPSSKAVKKEEPSGIREVATPISSLTPEEYERQKRLRDFENRKKQVIESRMGNAYKAAPQHTPIQIEKRASEEEPTSRDNVKTASFTFTQEPSYRQATPVENGAMRKTIEKREHEEHNDLREREAEMAAAHVAERVAMSNPTYKRSANEMYTVVRITESTKPEEEKAPVADTAAPVRDHEASEPTVTAESTAYTAPEEKEDVYTAPDAKTSEVTYTAQTPSVSEEAYATFTSSVSAESSYAEDIRGEYASEDVTANDSESAVSSDSGEEASASPFKTYEAPSVEPITEDVREEPVTLTVERTMLSPTPTVSERDKKYTLLGEDMPLSAEESEESAEENDDFNWSMEGSEAGADNVGDDNEAGTILSFGDDEDSEEDEAESEELYTEMPEEEAIITEEIPPEEQNPEVLRQRAMFPILDLEDPEEDEEDDELIEEIEPIEDEEPISADDFGEPDEPVEDDFDEELPPFDVDEPKPTASVVPISEVKSEKKEKAKPDYSDFVFPPIDLLGLDNDGGDEDFNEEIQENADKLIETLASFNVTASIKGVDRGPRITRYEVVPAKGVKVSNVMNLQDDIALGLAAEGIRMEAPIPGKSAIGVEIPNKRSSNVRLRELLETEDFKNNKSKTAVCIGKDVAGQPVINDIAKMPHLLIAGATGMGKSVCINSLMISILYKARPDEVKFIMIDPKQVEFTMYNGIPHLLVPVVSDAKKAAGALMWAVEEMEKRYNLLNTLCVRNIDGYNEKVSKDKSLGEPMSKIIIVIDEFADLMLQVKDPVENLVMRIAQKARAAGIHLIIGTQRPAVNVITGTIKANIPSRIACKVASNTDSRTVLDAGGAEKLLNKGDMLFAFSGAIKPLRAQGAFVADSEVEAIMNHLKQFSDGNSYDESVMQEIESAAAKCSKKGGSGDHDDGDDSGAGEGILNDRQFLDAVELAVNSGKIATSLIQRKLSIGYGKAAKFIDYMEDLGIVGEANGQRPRDVLMSPDEWREKLARTMID